MGTKGIKGSGVRLSTGRAAAVAAALLVAGCGTQTAAGGAGPADPAPGGVHADTLDTRGPTPPPTAYPSAGLPYTRGPATPSGPCPDSGMRIVPGVTNPAMGLRVLDVVLTNCGEGTFELYGYPRLGLAESDGTPVEGVRVLKGTKDVTLAVGDPGPRRLTLRPGDSAVTVLVWRNTYADTTNPPVTVDRVTVDPGLGRGTRTVVPDPPLDLGSTGRLGTTAWHKG
ncbi:DUF4232 domain-containing protein [Streptomyces longispororuber]|uniref:DUF4232 domain-containing protein n=1 Tax=Streptomyces longispororuber TaxID=68230 RepID=UPI00210E76EF|nr:DUF4232 domain-containing protein [Streptomyces longispororuber]MCQ4206252.1 DUF4232 domain-containing protein [Streptomyces longispororuber]